MSAENDVEPLWRLIRNAMQEKGMSVRALARALAADEPDRMESQRRKIGKWLDEEKPTTPSEKEARRLAAILEKPDDYFIRPRPRKVDQTIQRLEDELARDREALAAYRERYGPL